MKSLFLRLLVVFCFFCCPLFVFAQLPSYLPADGLVAWYPFNGNANDESGNGNDGVVNGNCFLVGDRFGNSNAAYFFDGYGDFIDAPDIMQDNFSVLITMRVANFMCCYNGQVGASIFSNFTNDLGFPGPNGVEIGFSASNELGAGNGLSGVNFNSTIQASTWYQLGLTKQGNNIKLYIDGVLVQESNDWISSSIGSTITRFGGRGNINPLFLEFNGILDDIAVYNRALSSTEVTGFYNGTPTNPNGGNSGSGVGSSTSPAPPGIPYQAEVRSDNGEVLANANVNVRFTLHELTANGAVSYQETHALTTNELGLFAATIGAGTATQGTFAGINWSQTTKFLQVEVDAGNGYITMGNQQLMSVPYAFYAANSQPGPQGPVGPQGPAGADGQVGPQGEAGANGLSAYELWLAQGNSGTQLDFLASGGGAPLFLQNTISFPGLGGDGTTAAQTLFTFNARFGERYSIQAKLSAWTARYTCSAGVNVWIENSSGTVVPIRGFDQFSFGVSDCNNAVGGEKICLGYFAPENTDEFTVRCNYSVGGYNNYQNQGSNSGGVQAMIYKL